MIPIILCHEINMNTAASKRVFLKSWALYSLILLAGCEVKTESRESDDISAFQAIVDINLPLRVVRWEIFGTPEYRGGVPAPTDFVTLIAEVPNLDALTLEKRSMAGAMWIVPEAARPWLSGANRSMLGNFRNTSVDFSGLPNCRVVNGKLRKTGEQVRGFVCNGPVKALIYLTLADLS